MIDEEVLFPIVLVLGAWPLVSDLKKWGTCEQ